MVSQAIPQSTNLLRLTEAKEDSKSADTIVEPDTVFRDFPLFISYFTLAVLVLSLTALFVVRLIGYAHCK